MFHNGKDDAKIRATNGSENPPNRTTSSIRILVVADNKLNAENNTKTSSLLAALTILVTRAQFTLSVETYGKWQWMMSMELGWDVGVNVGGDGWWSPLRLQRHDNKAHNLQKQLEEQRRHAQAQNQNVIPNPPSNLAEPHRTTQDKPLETGKHLAHSSVLRIRNVGRTSFVHNSFECGKGCPRTFSASALDQRTGFGAELCTHS
uniref:HDC02476 n=1 Tax=Drosophila melanogaster TaxID=7227 RepID=Q6IHJ6_DROME|nr:TPA_inf: HDC02476 [Drosophila melanogaster]